MQVDDSAHFGVRANLALVAGAVIQANIFYFQDPIMTSVVVYGREARVADISVPPGG